MKGLICSVMGKESSKAYVAMIFMQFVAGGLALFSKVAISTGINPYVFVFYRQAFATLSLAPFAFFLEREKSAPPLSFSLLCQIFLISLCGITLSLDLFYMALNYTTATFAAGSNNAVPAMTFALALLLRMESISLKQWHGLAKILGSVVCISGALVFALVKGPSLRPAMNHERSSNPTTTAHFIHKGDWIKGSLIMILAHLSSSLWLILLGPLVKKYPAKLRLTVLQSFFSWVQSALWAVAVERRASSWKLGWDVRLFSLIYCGVISAGFSNWLRVWVIEKKGAVFTAMFTPLALVITAIFSALFWNEAFHWGSVGGAVLLVVGLYSFLWGKHKEEKNSKKDEQKMMIMITENKEEGAVECVVHK